MRSGAPRARGPRRPAAPLDAARARAVALELLGRRAWTRRELRDRLRRRGASAEVAGAVVADLTGAGYLDDRAVARAWVETRAAERGLGTRRLRAELRRRGVAAAVVEDVLEASGVTREEEARARELAARRLKVLAGLERATAARRLWGYLVRRGFAPELAGRVVRSLCDLPPES